jgi:hypothetical protein
VEDKKAILDMHFRLARFFLEDPSDAKIELWIKQAQISSQKPTVAYRKAWANKQKHSRSRMCKQLRTLLENPKRDPARLEILMKEHEEKELK